MAAGADLHFKDKIEHLLRAQRRPDQTVIYASHDLDRLAQLCDRAIYLRAGTVVVYDDIDRVLEAYRRDAGE